MSEHYDFHYQPTGSGAISGQQVLQQTEDAINELGDYVNDNVGGAMDVAQQALETAQNAEQDAQTALDTANSFSDAIQSAQQDASTALSTAQTAQTTASNANNTAIQAQQDASSAVTTANNASGQVSTLSGTVTALGQRVTTAEGNIGQNTSDITALTTRVGTAEGNITTLQNDVSVAQGNASSAMATAGQVKQQAFVFRYSSTALVASSTNSNALLDNTDNLKVGDKVIDSSGVLFSITAIDTQNSTFTIGTALIDLAQDSDVVHKSGNETVGGIKTFDSNTLIYNSDNTAATPNLYLKSSKIEISSQGNTSGDQNLTYLDKNNVSYAYVEGAIQSNGTAVKIRSIGKDGSDNSVINELQILAYANGNKAIFPSNSNEVDLGVSSYKWKSIFATNYYYGSNNVEFSTKFVTTDTNQTISGQKVFDNINTISSSSEIGVSGGNRSFKVLDKNKTTLASIEGGTFSTGTAYSCWLVNNGANAFNGVSLYQASANLAQLRPYSSTLSVQLGASTRYFSDCYTSKINGVEPSSLSLPSDNLNDIIDISSYLSVLDGSNANTYVAPANGWISITMSSCSGIQAYITGLWGHQIVRPTVGGVRFFMPILKNKTLNILIFGGTIDNARFIPCQGNV